MRTFSEFNQFSFLFDHAFPLSFTFILHLPDVSWRIFNLGVLHYSFLLLWKILGVGVEFSSDALFGLSVSHFIFIECFAALCLVFQCKGVVMMFPLKCTLFITAGKVRFFLDMAQNYHVSLIFKFSFAYGMLTFPLISLFLCVQFPKKLPASLQHESLLRLPCHLQCILSSPSLFSAHIELLTFHNFYISDWLFGSGCKSHSDLPLVPSSFSINSLDTLGLCEAQ